MTAKAETRAILFKVCVAKNSLNLIVHIKSISVLKKCEQEFLIFFSDKERGTVFAYTVFILL